MAQSQCPLPGKATSRLQQGPSLLPGSPAWGSSDPRTSRTQPLLRQPEPLPDATCPSASPPPNSTPPPPAAWGLCLGTRGPYSRCRRRLAPAARRSWWSWDRRHLRAPGDWPSPRPRLQSPARPRRPPSQPLPQPLVPGPLPPLPARAPPPPAAPRPGVLVRGRGGARPPLPAIRGTQTSLWGPAAGPAKLHEPAAPA